MGLLNAINQKNNPCRGWAATMPNGLKISEKRNKNLKIELRKGGEKASKTGQIDEIGGQFRGTKIINPR